MTSMYLFSGCLVADLKLAIHLMSRKISNTRIRKVTNHTKSLIPGIC